jgi:biotin/lipoyl-binding protein
VKANVPVKAGDVLFQIDQAPFQYKVAQLKASLAAAKQQAEILKSNYEQATANVAGLTAQLKYNTKRLADIQTLSTEGANDELCGSREVASFTRSPYRRGSSLHSTTSEAGTIPVNAPTLGGWYLLQGQAVAISRATGIYALLFSGLGRREGERAEIGVARIEYSVT